MSAQPHGRADLLRPVPVKTNARRSKRTGNGAGGKFIGQQRLSLMARRHPKHAKAQRRLQQAADVLVQRLLSLALDGTGQCRARRLSPP